MTEIIITAFVGGLFAGACSAVAYRIGIRHGMRAAERIASAAFAQLRNMPRLAELMPITKPQDFVPLSAPDAALVGKSPNIRVQIHDKQSGQLIADFRYYCDPFADWRVPIIAALNGLREPCYHLQIDLMLPDGTPGFCEREDER